MGYSIRPDTQIKDFWPDDCENRFYVDVDDTSYTLTELGQMAKDKFGEEYSPDKLQIYAERIQTKWIDCAYHDTSEYDYTNFIIVELSHVAQV